MFTFICYPKCSTCAKARKWLDSNGIEYKERNIKEEPPGAEVLRAVLDASELSAKKLFNTSGKLYRAMGLKDRLSEMTDDEMLELLSTDGMLVKRPILIGENIALVGFKEPEWTEKLL